MLVTRCRNCLAFHLLQTSDPVTRVLAFANTVPWRGDEPCWQTFTSPTMLRGPTASEVWGITVGAGDCAVLVI
jgi:hypothetical protein